MATPATRTRPVLRVGIGGPVGSGKTALMDALCKRMRARYEIAADSHGGPEGRPWAERDRGVMRLDRWTGEICYFKFEVGPGVVGPRGTAFPDEVRKKACTAD